MSERPRVTERDKEHMRRIGRYKAEANAEALRLHLELPLRERLRKSLNLSESYRTHEAMLRHIASDDPSPLYSRARKLGLR